MKRIQRYWAPFFGAVMIVAQLARSQSLDENIRALTADMTLAEKAAQLHKEGGMTTAANNRLRIPGFMMADGPHGVREGEATAFPSGIALAATWDTALAQEIGTAMGQEFRAKGKNQALGPCMDLTLDPRHGRTAESVGEDPWLNARITTALLTGLQSTGAIATAKHYYTEYRQQNRTNNNYLISRRMLMEYHGLPFREAVQRGGVLSVMGSYNLVNGEQGSESPLLLTDILRERWGFPFYVVSDWGAIKNAERGIEGGCDLCMGSDHYQEAANGLIALVNSGRTPEATLDRAVGNILRTKYLSGMMDYYPPGDPENLFRSGGFCITAAARSMVLLKNSDNLLPLDFRTVGKIALIGPNAEILPLDATGSAQVTPDPFFYTPFRRVMEGYVGTERLMYARGCDISGAAFAPDLADALSYARAAEVVLFVGGLDGTQEGEGFDRANGSIELPGKQKELIKLLKAVNPRLIVVLVSGGVCGINSVVADAAALLQVFYPGQGGSQALGSILFGVENPAGRLPVTWPRSDGQLPAKMSGSTRHFGVEFDFGYRWYDLMNYTPEFAFGYGLSYTTFSYANLTISNPQLQAGESGTISAEVTNTGQRQGDEVVQLYLSGDGTYSRHYQKELKGFARVALQPGETKTVTFQITPDQLYRFNEAADRYEVESGRYTARIGGASDNLPLSGDFTVTAGTLRPDLQVANIYPLPRYPREGETVGFLATVINRGSGPTLDNTPLDLEISVDGTPVAFQSAPQPSIPAGGMRLVSLENSRGGWMAAAPREYLLMAEVNARSAIEESDTRNNRKSSPLQVWSPPLNLALDHLVTVSSIEAAGLEGALAADGDLTTRWSSQFSDPQWLRIDLGAVKNFNEVWIHWETACASEYLLEVSRDGENWQEMYHQKGGRGGVEKIMVRAEARWLRLTGLRRATQWGYSIYEIEIYNREAQTGIISRERLPAALSLGPAWPNPFNSSTRMDYQLARDAEVRLTLYDLLGREVMRLVEGRQNAGNHSVTIDARTLNSGLYFCRLEAGGMTLTRKLSLIK